MQTTFNESQKQGANRRACPRHLAPLCVALGIILPTAGAMFHETDPLAPVTVSHNYYSDDIGSVELQGACSVTPDTVSCWDVKGKPDADLAEKVKAYYIVNPNTELRYRFGFKNRVVVFKTSGIGNGGLSLRLDDPNFMQPGQIPSNPMNNEPTLQWFGIARDPADTTASVSFDLGLTFGGGTVPLKVGATGKVGNMTVRIEDIKSAPDRSGYGYPMRKQKAWTVSVAVKGFPGATVPTMNGRPMGLYGGEIGSVNHNGNPGPAGRTNVFLNGDSNIRYGPGLEVIEGAGTPHQKLFLGVNPEKVSTLQFNPMGQRKVTITGIPLDPQ